MRMLICRQQRVQISTNTISHGKESTVAAKLVPVSLTLASILPMDQQTGLRLSFNNSTKYFERTEGYAKTMSGLHSGVNLKQMVRV